MSFSEEYPRDIIMHYPSLDCNTLFKAIKEDIIYDNIEIFFDKALEQNVHYFDFVKYDEPEMLPIYNQYEEVYCRFFEELFNSYDIFYHNKEYKRNGYFWRYFSNILNIFHSMNNKPRLFKTLDVLQKHLREALRDNIEILFLIPDLDIIIWPGFDLKMNILIDKRKELNPLIPNLLNKYGIDYE